MKSSILNTVSKTLIVFIALIAISCSSTKIIGKWKDPNLATKQYGHIMVTALTPNVVAKGNFEERMAEILVARKVKAKGAGGVFNPEMKITDELKAQISQKLEAEGFDGLLTFALISTTDETTYVPGTTTYAPYASPYYGSYYGYYGYYGAQVYSPGYYVNDKIYTVEAVLYDVKTEKMVWAARSETVSPTSLDRSCSLR